MSRLASSLLMTTFLLWSGCRQSTPVVVKAGPLPAGTTSLQFIASLDSVPAVESPILDRPDVPGRSFFSFSFRVPSGSSGKPIVVGVAARDGSGCITATGSSLETLLIDGVEGLVNVPMGAVEPADCSGRVPRILSVSAEQISTTGTDLAGNKINSSTLTIRGWGIHPHATVRVAGIYADRATWRSPTEIVATVVGLRGAYGPAELMLVNPDGAQNARSDLFSFGFYGALSFAAASATISAATLDVVEDLNGDGKPDLAWLDRMNGRVVVLRNSGAGIFSSQALYPVGGSPVFMTAGDTNGDGKLDLVVAARAGVAGEVSVLKNAGDGTFDGAPATYLVPGGAGHISIADLNGDGWQDLAVATDLRTLTVLLNRRGGLFSSLPPSYPTEVLPRTVTATDVNGDGRPDLVINGYASVGGDGRVRLLLNEGDGTFPEKPMAPFRGVESESVAVVDMNRDGRPDLVALTSRELHVLLSESNGAFAATPIPSPIQQGAFTALTDFDGDGQPDFATSSDAGDLTVLLNVGTGRLAGKSIYSFNGSSFAVGDINRDGRPDLLACCAMGGGLNALINQGTGAFVPVRLRGTIDTQSSALLTRDFDGDGKLDVAAVVNSPGAEVAVLLNKSQ